MKKLLLVFGVLAVLVLACWSMDFTRAILFGWAQFVWRVVPDINWQWKTVTLSVVVFALFTLGIHWFGNGWQRARSSATAWRFGWALRLSVAVVIAFAAGVCMIGATHQTGWLLAGDEPLFAAVELPKVGQSNRSDTNMKMLMLGLHTYHDSYQGRFDIDRAADATPHHGWPLQALYGFMTYGNESGQIDLKKRWNDPVNERFYRGVIPVLINADLRTAPIKDADGFGLCHYAANSRAMANGTFRPLKDFADGIGNTLMIGEVNVNFRPWGDPTNVRDPIRGINRSPYGFGGAPQSRGAMFAMADGSVRFVSEKVSANVLRALATPDGGEAIEP